MIVWARKLYAVSRYGWCLWPGLANVWLRSSWSGLACAVFFAVLLNVAVVVSFVWTEVAAAPVRGGLWSAVIAVWLAGAVATRCWSWPLVAGPGSGEDEDLFPAALGEYLRGNWLEAEKLLLRIVRSRPLDAEARLLWTSVLRRTHRQEEARRRLRELSRLQTAARWQWEIAAEWELLNREEVDREEPPAVSPEGKPADAIADEAA